MAALRSRIARLVSDVGPIRSRVEGVTEKAAESSGDLPFVSVALITFNEKANIADCLRSLDVLDYPRSRYETVVVDGGSTDGTLEILRDFPVSLIIDTRKCRGLARNTAVNAAKGDLIAFIDADCLATPSWLRDHVRIHRKGSVLIVGGSVLQGGDLSLPTRIFHEIYFASQLPSVPHGTTWDLATCNASFKRSTFHDVGLFPQMDRGEDSLLCWEALKKGYEVVFDPMPQVVHIHDRLTFRSLFGRSREQGRADRELQAAFGERTPFKLPRKFVWTMILTPSLIIARLLRYETHLATTGHKQKLILYFPPLLGAALFWTFGYLTATLSSPLARRTSFN